ncbi:GNAT family N-acetyltransferase [Corynebacterium tuberculostearicum]|uniref:GNAT family N-acetyltransferase n=1 Tax=Corynebacterium tuberculostearicum TaxID=38304 RepID=UPI00265D3CA5|nr:GNAT family N-acetyltransferase [Corynebacterium tuberculostearicum]WKE58341.1 N-acetyltransferase [Corynebacterium tuberculostearicum]
MLIRPAGLADVPAMTDTLNWAIEHTDVIFRASPASIAEREDYLRHIWKEDCPCLIAESDSGDHLGWALYDPYRDPRVWTGCYETTIYLSPTAQGQGVGTALLGALVEAARADKKVHSLLALVVPTNAASVKLHEKFGFENVGTLKEVCYKFDHWLSLAHLQLLV